MELDHVLIAVDDLAAAAQMMEASFGLASIDGGRHPAWGTANRIVPLGDAYLELIAVLDARLASESVFGRWVASSATAAPGRLLGWAVRTAELEGTARRLGLDVEAGSRATSSGEVLRWSTAGIEQAAGEPALPFFIQWAWDAPHPGRAAIQHPAGDVRLTRLELRGDPTRLDAWLGMHQLPIAVYSGDAQVSAIHIVGAARPIMIRRDLVRGTGH